MRCVLLVLAAGTLLVAGAACGDAAYLANDAGNGLYRAGAFQGALDRYRQAQAERPDLAQVTINAGAALHQLQQYNPALTEFGEARAADDAGLRSTANYDRGNTLFRMERLDEAREAYKDALRDDASNRDAKFNIEVIDRIQEEQRRQQQQQSQPNGQPEGGPPQPGDGRPEPGEGDQPGQQPPQPQPGQGNPQPGQPPPQPGQGQPGEGQPTPSLPDALSQFRQNLTPDRALQLLDALRDQQRGLEGQLDGQPRPQVVPRGRAPDPLY